MRKTNLIFGVCVLMVFLFVGYFAVNKIVNGSDTVGLLRPDNQEFVSVGKTLYAQYCASCHGENMEGEVPDWKQPDAGGKMPAPPHNESGHTWHHPDSILFKITKYGTSRALNMKNYNSDMPGFEDVLTDKEIVAILSYIKNSWPEEFRGRHDRINSEYVRVK